MGFAVQARKLWRTQRFRWKLYREAFNPMKCGRKFCFHGSFGTKARARAKERQTPHSFIERKVVRGMGTRYLVLTGRRKRRK